MKKVGLLRRAHDVREKRENVGIRHVRQCFYDAGQALTDYEEKILSLTCDDKMRKRYEGKKMTVMNPVGFVLSVTEDGK